MYKICPPNEHVLVQKISLWYPLIFYFYFFLNSPLKPSPDFIEDSLPDMDSKSELLGEERLRTVSEAIIIIQYFAVKTNEVLLGIVSDDREVFLRALRFSPLLKNQHFQIPIPSGIRGPQVCQ